MTEEQSQEEEQNEEKQEEQTPQDTWEPKTKLGKEVKEGEIKDIERILEKGKPIMEQEIVDILLPDLEDDLLMIGQSKGKFGGGSRHVFKQTRKKTAEGDKPTFTSCAVVGNKKGYVGVGRGRSGETVPSRDKAIRRAKLNIQKIRRGCGSWRCGCGEPHSIPYAVEGKCGSIRLKLMPAPKGKGLVAQEDVRKILELAGIEDVWSKAFGTTRTTPNLIYACVDALNKLMQMKIKSGHTEKLGIKEGSKKIKNSQ